MSIYEKLCNVRNKVNESDEGFVKDEKLKILSQLMILAFTDCFFTDEIPIVFKIQKCRFSLKEIKEVLESFDISIQHVSCLHSELGGNTFEIIQAVKTEE